MWNIPFQILKHFGCWYVIPFTSVKPMHTRGFANLTSEKSISGSINYGSINGSFSCMFWKILFAHQFHTCTRLCLARFAPTNLSIGTVFKTHTLKFHLQITKDFVCVWFHTFKPMCRYMFWAPMIKSSFFKKFHILWQRYRSTTFTATFPELISCNLLTRWISELLQPFDIHLWIISLLT